ncbi:MAG TPA: CHAT domain-containing protein [Pyrinomonadaceae bacterium]|jgi:CHAT domain-containing protein
MNRDELARKLVDATATERKNLFAAHFTLCDIALAKSLQSVCYEVWTSEPQKVARVVSVLRALAKSTNDAEIKGYVEWTEAIKALVGGNLEKCLERLDKSERTFNRLGKKHTAATTQISKLYALALLGRYDEAVSCGLRARAVFLSYKDFFSVGKIEHNIGNLFWRRDFYAESEPYLASAHKHFLQIDDQRQMAMVENCQAFVKALQNDFRAAEEIYQKALARAEKNSFVVTEAEIEIGMSNLYLFQGRLDLALRFMESSRRKYDRLEMPHQTANCELEIADIYLELNLLPEASELYETASRKFSALGMQAERARCLLNHARALFLLEENARARGLLEQAETLFQTEGNQIAVAATRLFKAQLFYLNQDFAAAESLAEDALKTCIDGKNLRYEIFARWLLGEISLATDNLEKAREYFVKTLPAAEKNSSSIECLCLVSLGKICLREKNRSEAENFFRRAIEIIENTRSTLEAEEFRMAFLSDKLAPYQEIAKIKLADKDFFEALNWLERSRSRTLLDAVESESNGFPAAQNAQENGFAAQFETLRAELNWFYSRLNRNSASGLKAKKEISSLKKEVALREKKLAEIERRLQIGNGKVSQTNHALDIRALQNFLTDTTIVEYVVLDGKISAFVIDARNVEFCENIADENAVNQEIRQFLFQLKTGRFVEKLNASNREIAFRRFFRHSQKLYTYLIEPLKNRLKTERIVFIPANQMHYLPFHALSGGERFLVEDYEIAYAPGAAVLQNSLQKKRPKPESALLVACADEFTPLAETEIEKISRLFSKAVRLKGKKATFKNIFRHTKTSDVVHLACHGKFRPDNPLFSALSLYGENLTVRDARRLELKNKLIVLSACETGLNKIENGEEVIGLARGFLSAGAASLILSLWTVNDASTMDLMTSFYERLLNAENPAKALRGAQIQMLESGSHAYFWSPFFLMGNW